MNAIYHSQRGSPVFTVMGEPVKCTEDMPYTQVGLYFIESNLYFPIRGNGWYSHVMAKYLMENELITTYNIKYALYRSLAIKKDYVSKFINYVCDKKDGYEKFLINCMVWNLEAVQAR